MEKLRVSRESDNIESQSNSLINENLRENTESKNQENINTAILESTNKTTHLESKKLDSIKETTINTESSKLEAKRDSKNNNEMRFDSNGDEIVYEVRHKLSLWDYFMHSILFPFSCLMVYAGLSMENGSIILALIFFMFCVVSLNDVFYKRKNRFYVTNSGIGFERRHWFVIQKRFFRFGEVGMASNTKAGAKILVTPQFIFMFFDINAQVIKRKYGFSAKTNLKYKVSIPYWSFKDDIFHNYPIQLIKQKTKESLENQGREIYIYSDINLPFLMCAKDKLRK